MDKHMNLPVREKKYKCKVCDKQFVLESTLRAHEDIHTSKKENECNICGKTFYPSEVLDAHKRLHTEQAGWTGHGGKISCSKRADLESSATTHHRKKFKCADCIETFEDLFALEGHRIMHNGCKRFTCPDCNAGYDLEVHYKRHVENCGRKISLKRKKYTTAAFTCGICDKKLTSYFRWNSHMSLHKMRQYECEKCNFKFNSAVSWQVHMIEHECHICIYPECGRTFKSSAGLSAHMSRIHNLPDPFSPFLSYGFEINVEQNHDNRAKADEPCGQTVENTSTIEKESEMIFVMAGIVKEEIDVTVKEESECEEL